jgi:predicted nuclease of predicted toxin-antitoxin system
MKKLLLDENLPRQLKRYFSSSFDVISVPDLGWQTKKNGELLSSMVAKGITHLVTADRNLRFQQNLDKFSVIVVVIRSFDIRLKTLLPFVAKIEAGILNADPAEKFVEIDIRTE